MNKTTTLDLIFYAYNEADLKNSDRIQRSIDGDPLVQNDYNELLATLSSLDGGSLQPRESTVQKILDFAKTRK
ncbi:MAG: hypothetical protein ABI763_03450 [Bacteroidota bacterium]